MLYVNTENVIKTLLYLLILSLMILYMHVSLQCKQFHRICRNWTYQLETKRMQMLEFKAKNELGPHRGPDSKHQSLCLLQVLAAHFVL